MKHINVLAVGAHPDDVELSAAGTLMAQKALGHTIGIVDLTRGELGTRGTAETRDAEAADSAKILDLDFRINLKLEDGFFQESEESLRKLIEIIRLTKPGIVLANAVSDRHPDHARGASFISRACFLAGLRKIETQYNGQAQEAHRPKAVYHYIQEKFMTPDFVVDITEFMDKKLLAIQAFKTQFYDPESQEPPTAISNEYYLDLIRAHAREYGQMIGARYGEGFVSERPFRFDDLMK